MIVEQIAARFGLTILPRRFVARILGIAPIQSMAAKITKNELINS